MFSGLSLEQIDVLWASEEYKSSNLDAQIIEGIGAEKIAHQENVENTEDKSLA